MKTGPLLHGIVLTAAISFSLQAQVVWENTLSGASTFSSARCADLNGDSVLDVVIGAGVEGDTSFYGVCAYDGATGILLWTLPSRGQMFGSPVFGDVTGDGVPDVFTGGRRAQFYAIDGASGTLVWEYPACQIWGNCLSDSLPAFYTPQWLPDVNNDSIPDLLAALGGFSPADVDDTVRPPGQIVILSGADGSMIRAFTVPDNKETYYSPQAIDFRSDGNLSIIFGTGGETIAGSLWEVKLNDVLNNQPHFVKIIAGQKKGFIAPSSLTKLNGDGVWDIIAANFDGDVYAISGAGFTQLWHTRVDSFEVSSTPCIGFFNDDAIPDCALNFNKGALPFYNGSRRCVFDGASGNIIYQKNEGNFHLHSAVACNLADNWRDEILFANNEMDSTANLFSLFYLDAQSGQTTLVYQKQYALNMSSTPVITDMDGDGLIDIIFSYTNDSTGLSYQRDFSMVRWSTAFPVPAAISWGAYMGTNYDAQFITYPAVGVRSVSIANAMEVYPNPAGDKIMIRPGNDVQNGRVVVKICDLNGRQVLEHEIPPSSKNQSYLLNISQLSSGMYLISMESGKALISISKFIKE